MTSFASWVPIVTFILGWGSGVITAYAFYKDLARRIVNVEGLTAHLMDLIGKNTQDIAVLAESIDRRRGG